MNCTGQISSAVSHNSRGLNTTIVWPIADTDDSSGLASVQLQGPKPVKMLLVDISFLHQLMPPKTSIVSLSQEPKLNSPNPSSNCGPITSFVRLANFGNDLWTYVSDAHRIQRRTSFVPKHRLKKEKTHQIVSCLRVFCNCQIWLSQALSCCEISLLQTVSCFSPGCLQVRNISPRLAARCTYISSAAKRKNRTNAIF